MRNVGWLPWPTLLLRASVLRALLPAAMLLIGGCGDGETTADLVLRGGFVVDGSGARGTLADVAIKGGRVLTVGDARELDAERVIDVRGLVVAPGFVDLHSHADLVLLADDAVRQQLLSAKILQGVTTIVVGNCGLGVAPASPDAAATLAGVNGWMTPEAVAAGAMDIAEYLSRLETAGVPLNVGTLVPHGPLRVSAMGLAPGEAELSQLIAMEAALEDGLRAGAFGVSVGLIYPPGMFSPTSELAALASIAAKYDRLFTAHIRGSSRMLLRATRELIEVNRRSGARTHHSHLEAVGEPYWGTIGDVLSLEDAAREEGLAISHDVFPYTRAATMMSAIFPPWSLEGGMPALLERLADPPTRELIRIQIEEREPEWPPWEPGGWPHNLAQAVGWDGILLASVGPDGPVEWVGKSLARIAEELGREPFDVVAELMIEERGQVGQMVAEISGREGEIEPLLSILAHPAGAVISDAEDYGRGSPHPAHAGAFVRALRWNREHSLGTLEAMVRKMTSYPADLLGLQDRGRLRPGAPADVVVFDPETVADRARWDRPRQAAVGVRLVMINGRIVAEEGRYLGGLHGEVLRAGR